MAEIIFLARRLPDKPMYDPRPNVTHRGIWALWRGRVAWSMQEEDAVLLRYEEYSWPGTEYPEISGVPWR